MEKCILVLLLCLMRSWNSNGQFLLNREKGLLAGAASVPSGEQKIFKSLQPRFRLPNNVLPIHYELTLRPILHSLAGDLEQWTAPGSVSIIVKCVQRSLNITLHSEVDRINLDLVKVWKMSTNSQLLITNHTFDTEKTFYSIILEQSLEVGEEYSIFIDFLARVQTESLEGLYRSHYDDPLTGQTKYLAGTQFQAFAARRAFPCFDEPNLKATFKTTLGRLNNYTSLSNTPIINTIPIPGYEGWSWDQFNLTVPMPTYLVAIVISDFAYTQAPSDLYSKPVRTYGPKYLMDDDYGQVPSIIAAKVLFFFEKFFDVEYALHKMDSVGLVDFAAGAMENWGLNIYRDYMLFYSPTQNNERERRSVALTLNHELAHQWSGNLVTCDWWTMAWLNEGFATYLSYQGMGYTNPEFNPQKSIQNDCVHTAFRNDVLDSAHPTVLPDKGSPWETMNYNANLVYSKGAALLRMLEGFLTLTTLQKGLQTYMKQYSFQSTNQDQLFEILTNQSIEDDRLPPGITIKAIMDTWTLQKGFPLVKVNGNVIGDVVTLSQEDYKVENETRIYFIPVAVATKSVPNLDSTIPQYWLYQQSNGISIQLSNPSDWIVVNSGATGYYRVQYDNELREKIEAQLSTDHSAILLGSRTQLIDDYFTMAFDGKTSLESALGFTKYVGKELEESVWNSLFYHLRKPRSLLSQSSEYSNIFKSYMEPRVFEVVEGIRASGLDVTVGARNLFYSDLMDWSCSFGDLQCEMDAQKYYTQWKQAPQMNPIPPLLRPSIYCSAIRADGVVDVDNFFFSLDLIANETTNSALKTQLLSSLGCTKNSIAISLMLSTAVVDTQISKENAVAVYASVAANPDLRPRMKYYLDLQISGMISHFGDAKFIANAIASMCSHMSSQEDLDWVNNFIEKYGNELADADVTGILEKGLTNLKENIQWMATFGIPMAQWFARNTI